MRLLKFALTRLRSERGQALILAALAMVVILGFAALAIDVGYWYSQKREVQNAVDAAALAGAQELPDDPAAAETVAREYLTKNGVSETNGDTVSITFRRTDPEGDPTEWDSVVIEVERPAEAWFAKVFGINEAFIRDVRAVASYRGGSTFVPVDVVQIVDRTGSMTGTDMDNAVAGVRALLEFFDGTIQRVGLGVLPGGQTSPPPPDACHGDHVSGEDPESHQLWLPVGLSDDYQSSPHVLNEGSVLVSTLECLQSDGYTNIGRPMAAAISELQANGRPDVKWGIILFSDGVANRPIGGDTGWKRPTANAVAPGGDSNGFETNPTGAYTDDSSSAQDANSGTSTATSCGDSGKDRHDFYSYGISIPSGNNPTGIQVRLIARVNSTYYSYTRRMCVQLSWDGGVTWTAAKQTSSNLGSTFQTFTLGASDDNWGHTWTTSDLSDANFRVRVTDVADKTDRTFYLDWAAVRVYHTPGTAGPCEYAADQADIARSLGIEVFTIGYGLHDPDNPGGNYCSYDSGTWAGRSGWDLMEYMATDEDHFFDEPSTADLRPIFEVIGSQLAAGAHLVE